jgi:hypothetical protein
LQNIWNFLNGFQQFSSSKLVQKSVENRWASPNYFSIRSTAVPIIFEGQFQVFQLFSSSKHDSKLVLKTIESCFAALNHHSIYTEMAVYTDTLIRTITIGRFQQFCSSYSKPWWSENRWKQAVTVESKQLPLKASRYLLCKYEVLYYAFLYSN